MKKFPVDAILDARSKLTEAYEAVKEANEAGGSLITSAAAAKLKYAVDKIHEAAQAYGILRTCSSCSNVFVSDEPRPKCPCCGAKPSRSVGEAMESGDAPDPKE